MKKNLTTISEEKAQEILEKFRWENWDKDFPASASSNFGHATLMVEEDNRICGVDLKSWLHGGFNEQLLRVKFVRSGRAAGKSIQTSGRGDRGESLAGKFSIAPDEFFEILAGIEQEERTPVGIFDVLRECA